MAIISIFSGALRPGREISKMVAEALDYSCLDDDIYSLAAKMCRCREDRIHDALTGPPPFFNRITHLREKSIACLRLALAEKLEDDQQLLCGYLGHLIPPRLTHVLKICLTATPEWRTEQFIRADNLNAEKARREVDRIDKKLWSWTNLVAHRRPYNKKLYDLVIPLHRFSKAEVVGQILNNAKNEALQPTDDSRQALIDFRLAALVQLKLIERGYDIEVTVDRGSVSLIINHYVARLANYQKKIEKIASESEGVTSIKSRPGQYFRPPAINPLANIESPDRIKIAYRESDFELFLSDRLQTGASKSRMVHDGREAMACAEEDNVSVIVLDLTLPGISGIEVLGQIKHHNPNVEVVILAGRSDAREEKIASELGAFAYLVKPVEPETLTRVMKEAYRKTDGDKTIK